MIQPFRTLSIATSLVIVSASVASAQRTRGTIGVPRVVTSPAPTTHAPPPPSTRGVLMVPRYEPRPPTRAHNGDVPRIVTNQGGGYIRGRRVGSGSNGGTSYGGSAFTSGSMNGFGHRFGPGTSRRWRPGYSRPGAGFGCSVGCVSFGVGTRSSRFYGSFVVGYPFAVPIYVPYFYSSTYQTYAEPVVEAYVPEPETEHAASKLIVIGGGTGGGGDALTIETVGDSVRLSWLGANRPAREVKLFVADSAQRPLATRSASPASPTATFEVATLSAPVAFAGVTVTFADGVTTTTTVPYRGGQRR